MIFVIKEFIEFMGVSERKEREKEQRRQDIIDAAERVFFSKGFDNASMQDVADASELSKGTLYLYFSCKNDLCMAIIVRSLQMIHQLFADLLPLPLSGMQKLLQIADSFIRFSLEYPSHYHALLAYRHHSIECSDTGQIYQDSLAENEAINSIIQAIIEAGKSDGSISLTTDSEKLTQAIWGNLTGFLPGCLLSANQMNAGAAVPPENVLRYIFELIQNAIKA